MPSPTKRSGTGRPTPPAKNGAGLPAARERATRVRHAPGDAGQRDSAPATGTDADGGDWFAERIEPAKPSGGG